MKYKRHQLIRLCRAIQLMVEIIRFQRLNLRREITYWLQADLNQCVSANRYHHCTGQRSRNQGLRKAFEDAIIFAGVQTQQSLDGAVDSRSPKMRVDRAATTWNITAGIKHTPIRSGQRHPDVPPTNHGIV